jgi:hypothetical protein
MIIQFFIYFRDENKNDYFIIRSPNGLMKVFFLFSVCVFDVCPLYFLLFLCFSLVLFPLRDSSLSAQHINEQVLN